MDDSGSYAVGNAELSSMIDENKNHDYKRLTQIYTNDGDEWNARSWQICWTLANPWPITGLSSVVHRPSSHHEDFRLFSGGRNGLDY